MTYPVATSLVGKIGMSLVYAGVFVVVAAAGVTPFLHAL